MSHEDRPHDAAMPADPRVADASTNNPRTRSPADQVKVWEEEGGSPPGQIGATQSVKPKRGSKSGSMGAADS